MFAAQPTAPGPATDSDPPRDQTVAGANAPGRTGSLLGLVRRLIDYGKDLVSSLQQRTVTTATNLGEAMRQFGTIDIALIVSRVTRGLQLAAALEARLVSDADQQEAAPAPSARPPRAPSATQPTSWFASDAAPCATALPTPAQIAAQIRRRPIGAVIADICRDLGILPNHPLWRELSAAITQNGGKLANLVSDIFKRGRDTIALMTTDSAAWPWPGPQSLEAAATGPP